MDSSHTVPDDEQVGENIIHEEQIPKLVRKNPSVGLEVREEEHRHYGKDVHNVSW